MEEEKISGLQRCTDWYSVYDQEGRDTGLEAADFVPDNTCDEFVPDSTCVPRVHATDE